MYPVTCYMSGPAKLGYQCKSHLKCKVEGLLREVPDHAGQVAPPEAGDALPGVGPHHAVLHPPVAPVQPTLLEELSLVLEEEFDSLDWSCAGLRHSRGYSR